MSIWDGLADVFTGALGEVVLVEPARGTSRMVQGIFSSRPADDLGISMNTPMLSAKTSEISDIGDGDGVRVGATQYIVREVRKDGRGMTSLLLEAR